MDGPSALVVWGAANSSTIEVRIARSPLANLGLRVADLGLPADTATELEAKIDVQRDGSGKIDAKGKIDLWAARLKGSNGPTDVHVQGGASGVSGKPLDLDKGTQVTVAPFVIAVSGTLDPRSDGLGLDATWRTQPIACEKLVRAEASKLGPIVEMIQDIAHKTGAARVTGTANAAGVARWDTKAPGDLAVTFTTKDTCGISLFGL